LPAEGFSNVIWGGPAVIVSVPLAISPPVVRVRVCDPTTAVEGTETFTVALVALFTTIEFTVTPPVIDALVLVPKCVPLPITSNETAPAFCGSEEGVIDVIDAALAVTLKAA